MNDHKARNRAKLEKMANAYESPHEAATAQRILHGASLPIKWMEEVHADREFIRHPHSPCPACGHDHAASGAVCEGHFCSMAVIAGEWKDWRADMRDRFGTGQPYLYGDEGDPRGEVEAQGEAPALAELAD